MGLEVLPETAIRGALECSIDQHAGGEKALSLKGSEAGGGNAGPRPLKVMTGDLAENPAPHDKLGAESEKETDSIVLLGATDEGGELRKEPAFPGGCVQCREKPVFNKKERLCKACAHAKWRYGWEAFPPGWRPGDRLKRPDSAGKKHSDKDSQGKKHSDRVWTHSDRARTLEQERERVLTQGWSSVTKRERTTGRILKTGRTPSWTKFGQEGGSFPWDKEAAHGGGKGVLAALLAAEGSRGLLGGGRLKPPSGIEILQEAAANQGARSVKFSRGLPRLQMADDEGGEEELEKVRIMSPMALQQTAYPNEPASLVKVAVAAQVLLEIATSPRDPSGAQDENNASEQWKKPPPSRFTMASEDTSAPEGGNHKWGPTELDDLPLRSPDLDVHDEMQMGGTLEDLGVLENVLRGNGKAIQTGVFPPRIVTDGWTPRPDTDPLTLGTATEGWTPHQDLEGFTPRGESDANTPRSKTPSFHDIAANVFKAGRAAMVGRRSFKQRPISAEAKAKSPLGEELGAAASPRRGMLQPAVMEETTPPEDNGEDSYEMSPSAQRRKRKLKARQAREPAEEEMSGASGQDVPIVSPGVHKRSRTRATMSRSESHTEREESAKKRQGTEMGGKKRKGSWGGARKRGEKVVLPDSEDEETILPRIESATEANKAKRPRSNFLDDEPKCPEEAQKRPEGGGGLLDVVKGRWDDAQRLRYCATEKRAEAERLKRVAEAKQRLAQRLIERATELGNWPPGRKAKADERARRQQIAKKRSASESEGELEEFEITHSEAYSDEEEDYGSFDEEPSGTTPEHWGEDMEGEEESDKMHSLDQACTLPDEDRCIVTGGSGWRCAYPHLPGLQQCDQHAGGSQLRSQTKSEAESEKPEETATADFCPPFLDPLEPFKPKKHFGFRERTSFRPEHLQHLALRDTKLEAEPVMVEEPLSPTDDGFLQPEELLQLAKARQLKRARSARRHLPGGFEVGSSSPHEDGLELGEEELRGGDANAALELVGPLDIQAAEIAPQEGGEELPAESRQDFRETPAVAIECGAQESRRKASGEAPTKMENYRSEAAQMETGSLLQMVQSAAQTDEERPAESRADFQAPEVNPLYSAMVGLVSDRVKLNWAGPNLNPAPLMGSWQNGSLSKEPILLHRPQNGLISAVGQNSVSFASPGTFNCGPLIQNELRSGPLVQNAPNGLNGFHSHPLPEPSFNSMPPEAPKPPPLPSAQALHVLPTISDQAALKEAKESKPRAANGMHRTFSKRDHHSGGGVTRSRAIEDGLPIGRTYTLPVELKLPVELRQPVESQSNQPFLVQRGKRQATKKKKRIPPPIDGIDESMRCTKTGGSGWRCTQRRLEGYAKCERHMEIVAKRSRVEAKAVVEASKDGDKIESAGVAL